MRKFTFQTGDYYHLYNRGVDKRKIFIDEKDYLRFLVSMREFNSIEPVGSLYNLQKLRQNNLANLSCPSLSDPKPLKASGRLVEFISYCLNPNHFHFILEPLVENGISKFIQKLLMGYANYFNYKYQRSGVLFQGKYKAIHINNYGYLLKLLVYVNCNYEIHNYGKAKTWPWSSYLDSIGVRRGKLCNLEIIEQEFGNLYEFNNFCNQLISEIKNSKNLKRYLLE